MRRPPPLIAHTPQATRSTQAASQEARGPTIPLQRVLTDLQVVRRRVRLLLPEDGSVVFPSASPPPARIPPPPRIPQADPTLWMNQYVRYHSFEAHFQYNNGIGRISPFAGSLAQCCEVLYVLC